MKKQISLFILFSIACAFAQDSPNTQKSGKDPFVKSSEKSADKKQTSTITPKVISICYEAFSLPLALAAQHQRENLSDQDLYNTVVSLLETQEVTQETFLVLHSRSGETATVESVTEYIYPVEFIPGHIPTHVDVSFLPSETLLKEKSSSKGAPAQAPSIPIDTQKFEINGLQTSATPSAFHTRYLGITLEIQPTLSPDGQLIDLRINPQHAALVGRTTWGKQNSETQMPEIESQRINSGSTLLVDQPTLLGTMSRPPNSKIDPDSAQTTWYAFVTPRVIAVQP